jgi:hypothetical protein
MVEFVVQKVSVKIMHKSCSCIEAIVKKGSLKLIYSMKIAKKLKIDNRQFEIMI